MNDANGWKELLANEFEKPYMQSLNTFLLHEKNAGKVIYPKASLIFNAFNLTPFDQVRVVILGQDPYHGPNQAHGLCFSVLKGVKLPPSLRNIYKELEQDLKIPPADHGCLDAWAKQGVLLLNTVLTVEEGKAGSHQGKGWEIFTNAVIHRLNQREKPIIFVLWGKYAQEKGKMIDEKKHVILKSAHPSPLSAHQGFWGNHHFSRINELLIQRGENPIDWNLSEPSTNLINPIVK
jgi:uracil-DNA glycosylase